MRKNVPQQVSVSPKSKISIHWHPLTLINSLCLSGDLAQHVFTKIQILMEGKVLKTIKCVFSSQKTFRLFLLYKHAFLRSVCHWNWWQIAWWKQDCLVQWSRGLHSHCACCHSRAVSALNFICTQGNNSPHIFHGWTHSCCFCHRCLSLLNIQTCMHCLQKAESEDKDKSGDEASVIQTSKHAHISYKGWIQGRGWEWGWR